MRKGFDGRYGLVADHLKHDPLSGDFFLFVSSNRKVEFAVHVAEAKYLDHMPLRQVRAMGRKGLEVDSQTLYDRDAPDEARLDVVALRRRLRADRSRPIVDALREWGIRPNR